MKKAYKNFKYLIPKFFNFFRLMIWVTFCKNLLRMENWHELHHWCRWIWFLTVHVLLPIDLLSIDRPVCCSSFSVKQQYFPHSFPHFSCPLFRIFIFLTCSALWFWCFKEQWWLSGKVHAYRACGQWFTPNFKSRLKSWVWPALCNTRHKNCILLLHQQERPEHCPKA